VLIELRRSICPSSAIAHGRLTAGDFYSRLERALQRTEAARRGDGARPIEARVEDDDDRPINRPPPLLRAAG
jgi:hypothetical protein